MKLWKVYKMDTDKIDRTCVSKMFHSVDFKVTFVSTCKSTARVEFVIVTSNSKDLRIL